MLIWTLKVRFQSDSLSSFRRSDNSLTDLPPKSLMTHVPHSKRYPNQPAPFSPLFPHHNWSYRMWPWLNTRSHFKINHALHELGINHGCNRCSVSIPQSDCNGIFISSTINNISMGARSLPWSVCLPARLAAISRRVILRCSRAMMEGSRSGTKWNLLVQVPQVRDRWGAKSA